MSRQSWVQYYSNMDGTWGEPIQVDEDEAARLVSSRHGTYPGSGWHYAEKADGGRKDWREED